MAQIIDGKKISAEIRAEIKGKTAAFAEKNGFRPGLAVIIVGEDPASQVYVRNKRRACEEVGFYSEAYELPASTTQEELLALVDKLNADEKIHGILCQLPLPKHLDDNEVILRIDPRKDVDAFHPYNVGKIMIGDYDFLPCTPAGVMALIERSGIEVKAQAVTETKIEALRAEMSRHNSLIERTYKLEGKMEEVRSDIQELKAFHKPN